MKKLTAGIFTVILGLTTVDAFAAIPTQAYVDDAIEYALEQAAAAVYDDTGVKADIEANALAAQSAATAAGQAQSAAEAAQAQADKGVADAATAAAAAQSAADAAAAAQAGVNTLSGKVGTVPADKTVVQMISEAQSSATYDDEEVRGLITAAQAQADKGVADAATAQAQADKGVADAAAAAAQAQAAQATADSKLAVTGTCPAGETCYLDSTGAIQVAVKTYVKPTAQLAQQ